MTIKNLLMTVAVGVASFGGYQAYEYGGINSAEMLMESNIEALTSGEIYDGLKSKEERCPNGTTQVYCVTGSGRCLVQNC